MRKRLRARPQTEREEHLSAQERKAEVGQRQLLVAGTALPVLSMPRNGARLQQAQAQAPNRSTGAASGSVVGVDSSDTVFAIQAKLNSVPAGGALVFPANSSFNFNGRTIRGKSRVTILANGSAIIDGASGSGTAGAFDFGGRSNWTVRGNPHHWNGVFHLSIRNQDDSLALLEDRCGKNITPEGRSFARGCLWVSQIPKTFLLSER